MIGLAGIRDREPRCKKCGSYDVYYHGVLCDECESEIIEILIDTEIDKQIVREGLS